MKYRELRGLVIRHLPATLSLMFEYLCDKMPSLTSQSRILNGLRSPILSTLLQHALRREELCKLLDKDFKHERRDVARTFSRGHRGMYGIALLLSSARNQDRAHAVATATTNAQIYDHRETRREDSPTFKVS